jgi:urease accessory protein
VKVPPVELDPEKTSGETFRRNRATGTIALEVKAAGNTTRRARIYEDGSLRVRFPTSRTGQCEAVLVNTAGGMTGGDHFGLELTAGANANLIVTTAAAEKVYRSTEPDTLIDLRLRVETDAAIAWLPQETILFDRARLSRRIHVDLAANATVLLAEAVIFGRAAMGEALQEGRLIDRWRVRREGRLIFAEAMRLDGAIVDKLAQRAIAAGSSAVATLLMTPAGEAQVAAVRELSECFGGEVGASSWNGLAAVRFCAKDSATLRHDLTMVLTTLSPHPLPRLWLN